MKTVNNLREKLANYALKKEQNKLQSQLSQKIFEQAHDFIKEFLSNTNKKANFDFESKVKNEEHKNIHDTAKSLIVQFLGYVRTPPHETVPDMRPWLDIATKEYHKPIQTYFRAIRIVPNVRILLDKDLYPGFVKYMNTDNTKDLKQNVKNMYGVAKKIIENHDMFAILRLVNDNTKWLPPVESNHNQYLTNLNNELKKDGVRLLINRYATIDGNIISQFKKRYDEWQKANQKPVNGKIFENKLFNIHKNLQSENLQPNAKNEFNNLSDELKRVLLGFATYIHVKDPSSSIISRITNLNLRLPTDKDKIRKMIIAGVMTSLTVGGIAAVALVPGVGPAIAAGFVAHGAEIGGGVGGSRQLGPHCAGI